MTYEEFKEVLKNDEPLDNYWHLVIYFAKDILEDISDFGLDKVCPQLKISKPKLSNITPLLRVSKWEKLGQHINPERLTVPDTHTIN